MITLLQPLPRFDFVVLILSWCFRSVPELSLLFRTPCLTPQVQPSPLFSCQRFLQCTLRWTKEKSSSTGHNTSPFGTQQCFAIGMGFIKFVEQLILKSFNLSFNYIVLNNFVSKMPCDTANTFTKCNFIISCR